MPDLVALTKRLAAAREANTLASDCIAELRASWEKRHADELAAAASAKARLEEADAAVRAEALAIYATTLNQEPGPGVKIQLRHGIRYDVERAFEWVLRQRNRRDFLLLDDKALKARVNHDPDGLEFAEAMDLPTVLIASKLRPALKAWRGVDPH